jgi:hypothetical protein
MLIAEIRKLNGKGIQEHSALKHTVVFGLWLLSVLLFLLTKLLGDNPIAVNNNNNNNNNNTRKS